MPPPSTILTLNAGSASIKFALFNNAEPITRILSGKIERIGLPDTTLTVTDIDKHTESTSLNMVDHAASASMLLTLLEQRHYNKTISAIGHRIVHSGPHYSQPERINEPMLSALHDIGRFDPTHMLATIALIEACAHQFSGVPQIACFDTAFHRSMPRVAQLLPLPRRYDALGIRRYGFHGLSYTYLMTVLAQVAGGEAAFGRVVLAHLGNGASMAAVCNGSSIDTTMAFTPTSGLVMGTRSGDIDPGLITYFAQTEGMSSEQFYDMANKHAGLLGISETSPDVRDLLITEANDVRSAEALALFCYQAKKTIGALAAALSGLDTLVFSGGIGENAPTIRSRICDGLQFLGVALDEAHNMVNANVISKPDQPVTVRVIHTDEEVQIARSILQLIN